MSTERISSTASQSPLSIVWPMLVIAGLALTLRPTITSTGPLLEEIRLSTGMGLQAASLLVVLPMLCMGVFPLLLPWVGKRLSESAWITGGLIAIALAGVWRLGLGSGWALIASALIGGTGIAIVQAMAPGVVKRWYPKRVPLAMGIYSASLMAGGGIAATLSPLVAKHYSSWQAGLGIWLIVPVVALLMWWFRPSETMETKHNSVPVNFFKNRRAWLLASYFGLANAGYACMIAFLPTYARGLGWSAQSSGELIGIMTIFQVIGALGAPALSSSRLDRRPWLFFAVGIQIAGFVGLILLPESMLIVWAAMIGCGLGACFSLTLTVALDHLSIPKLAGALTAFVQGIGFIITAIVPYLAGVLREGTGSFQAVWMMLLITLICMLIVTIKFKPSSYAKAINVTDI
ncbi:CynX/NimT family MFS transporter [Psychrobacter frigidicola]|uniref:CynX/NimT family MFS transporter n=1 Tax=Psychrobacter frigidicola TaxID=45611 RepID=A0A5C7A350_9GAMM|nr:CynX/NimT family MFS transporter [Psychrobacter frigidicola]TXD96232.1 CynX/NimT family MFS transporter [Psychrobacter frigidicola]